MQRLAGGRDQDTTPVGSTAERTKPIRVTLDLRPTVHRRLKRWAATAAVTADLPVVPLAVVLRVLSDELLADEQLAERVLKRLRDAM